MRQDAETGGGRWRIARWGGAAALLLLPLVAMQVTSEVAWDRADFAIFGAMLIAGCGAYELAVRLTSNRIHRIVAALAIAAAFVLIWAQLAVGVFGD